MVTTSRENRSPTSRGFRLRWQVLLLGVVLLAFALIGSCFLARPFRQEHEIRQAIVAAGGLCGTEPGPEWLSLFFGRDTCCTTVWVDLSQARRNQTCHYEPIPAELLTQLGNLTQLRSLLLNDNPVSDENVASWTNLKSLFWLDLGNTLVRDPRLWPEFPLQRLDISSTCLGDAHATGLLRYPNLKKLNLSHTFVSNECVPTLVSLRQLECLKLVESGIDRRSHALLAELPLLKNLESILPLTEVKWQWYRSKTERRRLYALDLASIEDPQNVKQLDLHDTWFNNADIPQLTRFPALTVLNLNSTFVTDTGIEQLVIACPQLTELDVGNTQVTDGSMAMLAKLPDLWKLDIGRTEITDAGLGQLSAINGLRSLTLTAGTVRRAGFVHLLELPLESVQLALPGKLNRPDLIASPLSEMDVASAMDLLLSVERRTARERKYVDEALMRERAWREISRNVEMTAKIRTAAEQKHEPK